MRPAPNGYIWCKNVNEAQLVIEAKEYNVEWFSKQAYNLERDGYFELAKRLERGAINSFIELVDIDCKTDDYIHLLDWLEETSRNYPIRIHSMNPAGVENMR